MSAEMIVQFCSPTMAGLKVANLFSYRYTNKTQVIRSIKYYNEMLNHKGLYFKVLKCQSRMALIYAFRLNKLKSILLDSEVQEFLTTLGYCEFSVEYCLEVLQQHLLNDEFPHEVGIFLGYPLLDVKAFIVNKGQGHKSIGHWKVYYNEEEANILFQKYDKCIRIYEQTYKQGVGIGQLTVAG